MQRGRTGKVGNSLGRVSLGGSEHATWRGTKLWKWLGGRSTGSVGRLETVGNSLEEVSLGGSEHAAGQKGNCGNRLVRASMQRGRTGNPRNILGIAPQGRNENAAWMEIAWGELCWEGASIQQRGRTGNRGNSFEGSCAGRKRASSGKTGIRRNIAWRCFDMLR